MSTYLYIWFISYVQTDLAKIKSSTRGFESIVVIIEYSPTFSYQLSPEKARLCISDTRPHKEHQRLSAQHPKGLILKQILTTLIQKSAKIYEKLGILGGF